MVDAVSFNERSSILAPARYARVVDISSTDFIPSHETRALFIGTAGIVQLTLAGDLAAGLSTAVPYTVIAGTVLAVQVGSITRTGTTAGGMIVLW